MRVLLKRQFKMFKMNKNEKVQQYEGVCFSRHNKKRKGVKTASQLPSSQLD